jgi:protein O-GlcNAc transferase
MQLLIDEGKKLQTNSAQALREALKAGLHFQQSGKLQHAERVYRDVLHVFPDLPEALYLLGSLACQNRHFAEAEAMGRRLVSLRPEEASYQELLGRALKWLGRAEEALTVYQRAVELAPGQAELLIGLGLVLKSLDRHAESAAAFESAIAANPRSAEAWVNLGNAQRKRRDWNSALTSYERAVEINPGMAQAHNNLGAVLIELNDDARARQCLEQALALRPGYAEAIYNIGRQGLLAGDFAAAGARFREALGNDANYADAWIGLGVVSADLGDAEQMVLSFSRAAELRPNDADTFFAFGAALMDMGQYEVAVKVYEHGLRINPDAFSARNNLGVIQNQLGRMAEADATFRSLLASQPGFAAARLNYGNMLVALGRVDEALAEHRALREMEPDSMEVHANILLDLCYLRDDPAELIHEHLDWPRWLRISRPPAPRHANVRDASRRLRVGFVSGDFRLHSVAYFMEPLFQHLDPAQFEIHAYSNSTNHDTVTERLKQRAFKWRRIANVPDEEVARWIIEDGVDILLDLSGHTGGNRIGVFGRKPAPVQACWLGYPTITGLPTMDFRLTDWQVDPAGVPQAEIEKPVRLPHSYFCFQPAEDAPPVGESPAQRNGFLTFGSFNNLAKLGDATLALWCEVLDAIPDARLVVKCKGLADPQTQARLRARLCAGGRNEARVSLLPWERLTTGHLRMYNEIDIALDSFPYNGATTTCEALWMGVPVVTLAGGTHPGRMGVSILSAAGLPEFVVRTRQEYLALCRDLNGDRTRLAGLRAGLRQKLQASPLLDGAGFGRDFGSALRQMWEQWCGQSR